MSQEDMSVPEDLVLAVQNSQTFITGETDKHLIFFVQDEKTGVRTVIGQLNKKKHADQIAKICSALACANTITKYMRLGFQEPPKPANSGLILP